MFGTGRSKKTPHKKRVFKSVDEDGVVIPKLPRLELPKDFNKPRAEPLFSIPKEFLHLPVLQKKFKEKVCIKREKRKYIVYFYALEIVALVNRKGQKGEPM